MTEKIAASEPDDSIAPSILVPQRRLLVPMWVLLLAVVASFASGWFVSQLTTGTTVSSGGLMPQESATPTPTVEEVDTEDDSVFVDLATRDIDDFAKDLGDLKTTVDEDGFWRLLSNSVELNYNAGQLLDHKAPKSIKKDWNAALATLQENVDTIEDGVTSQSDKTVLEGIREARETIAELRGIVSRVD